MGEGKAAYSLVERLIFVNEHARRHLSLYDNTADLRGKMDGDKCPIIDLGYGTCYGDKVLNKGSYWLLEKA